MNRHNSKNHTFNKKHSGKKQFLTEYEINNITKRFPDFELSYEKLVHKKVSSDIYVVIPKGKKYLLSLIIHGVLHYI